MPHQLCKHTRVATEQTSSIAASSVTLEQNHNEPTLRRSVMKGAKRGFSGSSKEIACKLHVPRIGNTKLISVESPSTTSEEKTSSQRWKKRRLTQSKDLSSECLSVPTIYSLDTLYRAQLHHQSRTKTIVGEIESRNRRLIAKSRELLDPQICTLFKDELEGLEDGDNQARTLFGDLLAQQRRLLKRWLKATEQLARTLLADLEEGMWIQQRRVLSMKQFIQQHRAGEECD